MLFLISGLPAWAADDGPILVDLEPPRITIIQPVDSATITEERPWIEVEISDEGSGINSDAIFISVNGVDVTAGAIIERIDREEIGAAKQWHLRYRPPVSLPPGPHHVQIDASDTAGNSSRRQWSFYLQVPKPKVSWDASLTNVLDYHYLPLERLHDTANFTSYLQLPGQLFTLQLQTSVTDYPGLRIEPNFYDYYLYLDQYTIGWQTEWFALQHGNLNLPFESGLLLFGLGFKGSTLSNGLSNQTRQWRVFKGTTVSSFGLGLSVMETSGGLYRWQTGAAKNQVYYLQMGNDQARIVGFLDDRVFGQGILRSELIYGLAEEGGGGFRVQGATELAGVFWDADCIFLQESYPLASLSPLPSTQGGVYQYALRGDKLFLSQKRVSFGYIYSANNLDGSVEKTRRTQSWQLNLSGNFTPDFGWLLGYQAGKREEYDKSQQHLFKMGIHQQINDGRWQSNLSIASSTPTDTRRYQWDFGYTKPWSQYRLKTTGSLRYTIEEQTEDRQSNKLRLRVAMEKDWFADLAKSYLVVAYHNNNEKNPLGGNFQSEELLFEGTLHLKVGNHNVIKLSGQVSFWENSYSYMNQGTDYRFSLLWQSRLF